jgi:hypothetical protein
MGEDTSSGLAAAVAAAMPAVVAAIPAGPAAVLGRLRSEPPAHRPDRPDRPEPPVVRSLRELPSWLVERVHGALERPLAALAVPAPAVTSALPPPPSGSFAFLTSSTETEALRETRLIPPARPGLLELVAELAADAVAQGVPAPFQTAEGDEAAIAAAHGAAHLALAVVTAAIALREAGSGGTAAIVGTALGVAAGLLRVAPMPPGYDEALVAKHRAEYRLPQTGHTSVPVRDHRFALAEGAFPAAADFGGNGLAAVADGGVVIRTGTATGTVSVGLRILAEPPAEAGTLGWEEVLDVSWTAGRGSARLLGPEQPAGRTAAQPPVPGRADVATPPWPGDYRVRVHAYGRDDPETESYDVWVWAAPAGPPEVHARADRLGHRLRGEPEPPAVDHPEVAYRWIERSRLCVAATVTVVVGASAEEVLRGFGADPADPVELADLTEGAAVQPWLAVLDRGDDVLVIEENGFAGTDREVLAAVSRTGRAASMFWNVNAVKRLSFARGGEVLASFEPGLTPPPDDPEITAALAGLDLGNYRDSTGKGLVAMERLAGRGLHASDLEQLDEQNTAYLLAP